MSGFARWMAVACFEVPKYLREMDARVSPRCTVWLMNSGGMTEGGRDGAGDGS